ncbi:hypothetical protein GCM10009592_28340 [Brachybacterium rhamnosum]|uniref:Uncharacterized protein n=1 Tax=Brachybacterium rhamnosum TaxID=173361 RepID=A0ABW4Q3W9_9MICO
MTALQAIADLIIHAAMAVILLGATATSIALLTEQAHLIKKDLNR